MTDVVVPGWYRTQWDNNVKVRFQNRGHVLQGTVSPPVKIDGKKFTFLRTGKAEAQPYAKGDSISPLNPEDDTVEMESSEWDAPFALYDWDVTRLPVREQDARKQQAAAAIGRRADRIIYDAVMATVLDGSQVFGAYTDPFDPYVFKAGLVKLAKNDVDTGESGIFAPLPALAIGQLETYQIFAKSDWIGGDLPLRKMVKAGRWDMANWFQLPEHLVVAYTSTTESRFRIWHRDAVGAGHNAGIRTEWTRQGEKKRWLVNHTIDGCAVGIQPEGIIEFRMKADSTLSKEVMLTEDVGA